MPKFPAHIKAIAKPIATLAKNVSTYAKHQQAKHIAAQTVTLVDDQEAFDIQRLGQWTKGLKLKGEGQIKQVCLCENASGKQFLTTRPNSIASYVERTKVLAPSEVNQRLRATLESPHVKALTKDDPELKKHVDYLLDRLTKNTSTFGLDTRRQKAIAALAAADLANPRAGLGKEPAVDLAESERSKTLIELADLEAAIDSFDPTSSDDQH